MVLAGHDEEQPASRVQSPRERILDVALDLFTEKGFDATFLREIPGQLGVTEAALHHPLPSRAGSG